MILPCEVSIFGGRCLRVLVGRAGSSVSAASLLADEDTAFSSDVDPDEPGE